MFDNSHSFFKTKKITYSVVLSTPLEQIERDANVVKEKTVEQNEINNNNDISNDSKLESCDK